MHTVAQVAVAITFITVVATGHRAMMQGNETPQSKPVGSYATINRVRMYYEVVDASRTALRPLVLLDGALSTIAMAQVPMLRTVYGEVAERLKAAVC
jgi:hypothetical protein